MNLGTVVDTQTGHCRSDAPAAPIALIYVQSGPEALPVRRHGHRQAMSGPVLRALKWLRKQDYAVTSADVRTGAGIENYLIGSVFQRLIERGYIVRSGVTGRFKYRAVQA